MYKSDPLFRLSVYDYNIKEGHIVEVAAVLSISTLELNNATNQRETFHPL